MIYCTNFKQSVSLLCSQTKDSKHLSYGKVFHELFFQQPQLKKIVASQHEFRVITHIVQSKCKKQPSSRSSLLKQHVVTSSPTGITHQVLYHETAKVQQSQQSLPISQCHLQLWSQPFPTVRPKASKQALCATSDIYNLSLKFSLVLLQLNPLTSSSPLGKR